MIVTLNVCNKNFVDEIEKKHKKTSPERIQRNFLTKQKKLDLELTFNGFGKPFRENSNKYLKNSQYQCQNAGCEKNKKKAKVYSNTIFSLYFIVRAKKFDLKNHEIV